MKRLCFLALFVFSLANAIAQPWLKHLPTNIQEHRPEVLRQNAEGEELEEVYEREIVRLMTAHHGNVSAVARSMGRSRMQIHRWLKRLALNPDSFRR